MNSPRDCFPSDLCAAFRRSPEPDLTRLYEANILSVMRQVIGRFIHLERGGGKEVLIFPRFQQFDAVRKLLADAKAHGAGQNYLIQHSAGSSTRSTSGTAPSSRVKTSCASNASLRRSWTKT